MSEERMEILRMLGDKVITVEEAERLLKALEQAENRRAEAKPSGESRPRSFSGALDAITEALAGIGPTIGEAVGEAASGLVGVGVDLEGIDDEHLEPLDVEKGSFVIPEGSHLVVRHDATLGRRGGELRLIGGAADRCEAGFENGGTLRVRQGPTHTVIRWSGGLLKVTVPSTVARLSAATLGESIRVEGVGCQTEFKTLGGDLVMAGMTAPFKAKTMGGNLALGLAAAFSGDAKASTMGGNIALAVPTDLCLTVKAVTMGGSVKVEEGMGTVDSASSLGRMKAGIVLGKGEPKGCLSLKTMGGTITVGKADHA